VVGHGEDEKEGRCEEAGSARERVVSEEPGVKVNPAREDKNSNVYAVGHICSLCVNGRDGETND